MTFLEFTEAAKQVVASKLPGATVHVRVDGAVWCVDIWPRETPDEGFGAAFDPGYFESRCAEHGRDGIASGIDRVMRARAGKASS